MGNDIGIGIQLYTVRDLLKDPDSFKDALRRLAELGYDAVEFAWNYGQMSPDALAAFLDEVGLKCCGMHGKPQTLADPDDEIYRYAEAVGCDYLTVSLAGAVAKDWRGAIEDVKRVADIVHSKGRTFTYHNHAQEFEKIDGVYALDMLYDATDPAKVQAELDTYWIQKGGEDPEAYLRKYADRLPQIHVKDMNPNDESFTWIGNGCVDVKAAVDVAKDAGTRWLIYEQDQCELPQIECAGKSVACLKSILC